MMNTVICDARADFRQGLRNLLERENVEVVGEASDGHEALRMVGTLEPDALIVDMNARGLDGFELARRLAAENMKTRAVILSLFDDEVSVLGLFNAGVAACVLKTQASTDLVPALHQLLRGRRFLSPGFMKRAVDPYLDSRGDTRRRLSATETEVLHLLALDTPKDEIARKLLVTVEDVEDYRKQIMQRLNAVNSGALIRYAVRNGLLQR